VSAMAAAGYAAAATGEREANHGIGKGAAGSESLRFTGRRVASVCGRDPADVALSLIFGPNYFESFRVWTEALAAS
jgi:hypothetical protein